MSAEIEQRLADTLRPGEPPAGSLQMALEYLDTRAPARRTPSRARRVWGGVALAGTIAGFGALLVLAMPRGTDAPAPTPTGSISGFSVLGGRAFPDPGLVTVRPDGLGFPGVQPGSLRLARDLPTGVRVLVGRTNTGFVCLFAVPPRISFRSGTCAPAEDVRRAALVQSSWWNRSQTIVLVPDGTTVSTVSGQPVRVRNNVAVLERTVRQVVLRTPAGDRRVRFNGADPVPLTAADRQRPAIVPDLTDLTPFEAAEVLKAARLADGALQAESVDTAPNRVVGQRPLPGAAAPAGSDVRLSVSAPLGPNGTRVSVAPDTVVRWAPPGSSRQFRTDRLAAFRGTVTVLVFARLRADAEVIAKLSSPLTAPAPVAVALNGSEAKALSFRRARGGFGVVADPAGALGRAVGVTSAPAVVILDREGRVAYRRSGRLDVREVPTVMAALRSEPAPPDAPLPEAPAAARYLQAGTLLAPEDVPQSVLRNWAADVIPERVRAFGPTSSGWRAWIAINRPRPGIAGTTFTVVTTRGVPRGTLPASQSGAIGVPPVRPGQNPWVLPLGAFGSGKATRLLWVVGPGYTEVINFGDASITNGLLEIQMRVPMPREVILNGPAGRATIPVR